MPIRTLLLLLVLSAACDGASTTDSATATTTDTGSATATTTDTAGGDGDVVVSLSADCNATTTRVIENATTQQILTTFYAIFNTDEFARPLLLCGHEVFGAEFICPDGFTCSESASDPALVDPDNCFVSHGFPAGSKMAVACGSKFEVFNNGVRTSLSGSRALTAEQL